MNAFTSLPFEEMKALIHNSRFIRVMPGASLVIPVQKAERSPPPILDGIDIVAVGWEMGNAFVVLNTATRLLPFGDNLAQLLGKIARLGAFRPTMMRTFGHAPPRHGLMRVYFSDGGTARIDVNGLGAYTIDTDEEFQPTASSIDADGNIQIRRIVAD